MTECGIKSENIRLLGRMDTSRDTAWLDWTGSGFEVRLKGSALWAELEAPVKKPDMWVACAVDGFPIARFPVAPGRRWYPLALGMDAALIRTVTLMKETQPMPHQPDAAVIAHALRYDGELLPLPEPALRIEFIGDSITSAEGALAPKNNTEWMPMWFSACGNYTHYACRALNAERRVLSQSGWGVCWDYLFHREANMADGYERIVGPLTGASAEARGCQEPYDFAGWKANVVCIRLLANDVGGMNRVGRAAELTPELTDGCVRFIRKVRACNPDAHIIWIVSGQEAVLTIGHEAVNRCQAAGMERVSAFELPAYGPDDCGARNHPNAAFHERIGLLLADYIASIALR